MYIVSIVYPDCSVGKQWMTDSYNEAVEKTLSILEDFGIERTSTLDSEVHYDAGYVENDKDWAVCIGQPEREDS